MSSVVRPHVPEEELHAFADGELSSAQRAEIAEHLLACLICRSQQAEVDELRERSKRLLAVAAPRVIRRRALPIPAGRVRPWRGVAAAAVAILGASTWLAVQSGPSPASTPRLATAFVAPALFAGLGEGAAAITAPAATTQRTLTLASRASVRPQVVAPAPVAMPSRRFRPVEPMAEFDPSAGWEAASWDAATALAHGAVSRLDGFQITAVRVQRSANGGRPTFVVRHTLPDGRSLWVVEGPVDEVGPVHQLLEASGLSMSVPLRTRPDYVGTDDAPRRTVRMVTVAAYLPVDSLNSLMGKLVTQ